MKKTNRMLLFIFACLTVRILFVYIAKIASREQLRLLSIPAIIIGISFFYQSLKNKQIGFFGGKAWWSKTRNVHGVLWIVFAILAFNSNKKAYIALVIDVIIGIISFIHNYFN